MLRRVHRFIKCIKCQYRTRKTDLPTSVPRSAHSDALGVKGGSDHSPTVVDTRRLGHIPYISSQYLHGGVRDCYVNYISEHPSRRGPGVRSRTDTLAAPASFKCSSQLVQQTLTPPQPSTPGLCPESTRCKIHRTAVHCGLCSCCVSRVASPKTADRVHPFFSYGVCWAHARPILPT